MRLVVLASTDSWYLADLRRAAAGTHEVIRASFEQLASAIGANGWTASSGQLDLSRADCLLVRSMPAGSLEQIIFRMDVLGRLAAAGVPVVNPPRALEAAVDKYLASARLQAAGLLVPQTIVCQTLEAAMSAFDDLGRDVVFKPLFGSEGRGMERLTDQIAARQVFQRLVPSQSVFYLQQFVPHPGHDFRLLLVDDRVLAMKRVNPGDWRTNIAQGATAEPFRPTAEMIRIARTAAAAVGAPLAAVDLLPGLDGQLYTLEVNAVPGWRALSAALGMDVAELVLEYLSELVS
jgi:RimK family alpha-L-glutamate ligase